MKFGRLIQNTANMRNNFLEKSYIKYGGEIILKHFTKKSKLRISLYQQSKIVYSLFLVYVKLRAIEIQKPSCRPLAFTPYQAFFKKTKRGLELVSLRHFLYDFEEKIFSLFIFCYLTKLHCLLPLLCEILGNMCTVIVF